MTSVSWPNNDPLGPKAQVFPDNIALHSWWFNSCFVYGCFSPWVLVAVLEQQPPELVLVQQPPELSNNNQCWGKLSRGKSSISEALLELNNKVLFPWCLEVLFVIWWIWKYCISQLSIEGIITVDIWWMYWSLAVSQCLGHLQCYILIKCLLADVLYLTCQDIFNDYLIFNILWRARPALP